MTLASYQAYLTSIQCCIANLADKLSCEIQIDSCEKDKTAQLLEICAAMYQIMLCYQLCPAQVPAPVWPYQTNTCNCLSPDQMQCMSQFLNKICGTTYCIDFILTPSPVGGSN